MIGLFYNIALCFMLIGGVYGPTCTDFPMLDGKGDIRLDVALLDLGASSSVSYGITNNLFVQGEAFYDNDGIGSHYYGQATSGWYNNQDNRVVELSGGVCLGYGNTGLNLDRSNYEQNGNYGICFLQGDYGWKGLANSHLDVALGAKLGYYGSSLSIYNYYSNKTVERFFHGVIFEPTVNLRFGWEKLKFNLKIGRDFRKEFSNGGKFPISGYPRFELSLNYHFKSGNRE